MRKVKGREEDTEGRGRQGRRGSAFAAIAREGKSEDMAPGRNLEVMEKADASKGSRDCHHGTSRLDDEASSSHAR